MVHEFLRPRREKALCSCAQTELLLRTFTQVKPEHALRVQPQQEVELGRHGVEFGFSRPVVVVVVGQGVEVVWVIAERPEAVQVHVLADLHRQTGHDDATAEPHRSQALRAPEVSQSLEVVGVKEDRPDGASEVLDGVESPHGDRSVVAVREGRKEQQGVVVDLQTFHKWTATPIQSPVPENEEQV